MNQETNILKIEFRINLIFVIMQATSPQMICCIDPRFVIPDVSYRLGTNPIFLCKLDALASCFSPIGLKA